MMSLLTVCQNISCGYHCVTGSGERFCNSKNCVEVLQPWMAHSQFRDDRFSSLLYEIKVGSSVRHPIKEHLKSETIGCVAPHRPCALHTIARETGVRTGICLRHLFPYQYSSSGKLCPRQRQPRRFKIKGAFHALHAAEYDVRRAQPLCEGGCKSTNSVTVHLIATIKEHAAPTKLNLFQAQGFGTVTTLLLH